tara:strand:+ start:65 stop:367 length:303 start_codon:yes stop_codon:yes gene_type:complete
MRRLSLLSLLALGACDPTPSEVDDCPVITLDRAEVVLDDLILGEPGTATLTLLHDCVAGPNLEVDAPSVDGDDAIAVEGSASVLAPGEEAAAEVTSTVGD